MPDPVVSRCVAAVLAAVAALLDHPALAGHARESLATSAVGLVVGLDGPDLGRLAGRAVRVADAIGLCACQLGLSPTVLAAMDASDRLLDRVAARGRPRRACHAPITGDPARQQSQTASQAVSSAS